MAEAASSPDPHRCPHCGQMTAYFDPVSRVWECPCGWENGQRKDGYLWVVLILSLGLLLGGCAEVLSALAASGLTGWLMNRDSCTVQTHLIEGKTVGETRICVETSILPKGLRDWLTPLLPPAGESPPSPPAPSREKL